MIRKALEAKLKATYPGTTVLKDVATAGVQKPFFLIKTESITQKKEVGNRYLRSASFDVQYHSDAADAAYTKGEALFEALEVIDVGRAQTMNFKVKDEILHFAVQYTTTLKTPKTPLPTMKKLEVKESAKTENQV